MSEPEDTFETLALFYQDGELWSIEGELTLDQVAGLMIGFYVIFHSLYEGVFDYQDLTITLDGEEQITLEKEEFSHYLSSFILTTDESLTNYSLYHAEPEMYLWWVLAGIPASRGAGKYFVVQFASLDLVRGFIMGCEAFQEDFRDYSVGLPRTYDLVEDVDLETLIQDYDITSYLPPRRESHPSAQVYYNNIHESGDVDFV